MDKKKINKIIKTVVIAFIIICLVWFIVIYPLIDFSNKEKTVLNASKTYFEKNANLLPDNNEIAVVKLRTLLSQKYVSTLKSTYGRKYCNVDNSWVKVKRNGAEYKYYVYLECGTMKSSIDHDGPVIKLNGDEEIEIEKGTEYKDAGVASVYDETDGKMSVKDVKTTGKVNTDKIGTYTINYEVSDSFENVGTAKRTVKVIQTLDKMVKTETGKDNIYKGDDVANYIEFSNMLFRIVGLNSDGTVKLVSAEPIGTVNYDDISKWLNDYFYDHLTDNAKKYMVKQNFCTSKIEKDKMNNNNSCDSKKKEYVGLLSMKEYNASKEDELSYLYPDTIAWTSDYLDKDEAWTTRNYYIGYDEKYMSFDKEYNFAVYPVVNIKKGIKITGGSGTAYEPYKFSTIKAGKVGDKINTRYTGEYVSYNNRIYRIIESDRKNAKVISINNIGSDEVIYSNDNSIYNPKEEGNVGYYIENTLSKILKKDIFVKHQIEVPIYKKKATYSGKKTIKKYKVTLAAPNMYEMFSGVSLDATDTYWLINSSKDINTKYVVSNNNTIIYTDVEPLFESGIRVTGYIDSDVTILSGKGTKYNPYVLTK